MLQMYTFTSFEGNAPLGIDLRSTVVLINENIYDESQTKAHRK